MFRFRTQIPLQKQAESLIQHSPDEVSGYDIAIVNGQTEGLQQVGLFVGLIAWYGGLIENI